MVLTPVLQGHSITDQESHYVVQDPFVSNRHLRIYTIVFDRDNPQEVAPLVYAQDISMNGTLWNGYPMGKGNGSFLLRDGDILQLSLRVSLCYRCGDHKEDHFDMLQKVEMRVFENMYTVTQRKLGSGAYGQVHMAFEKETGQQLACKIIDLRALSDKFFREAEEQQSRLFKKKLLYSSTGIMASREFKKPFSKKVLEKLKVYNREAKILANLSHPNIIGIEKVIKSSNTVYLFQELITAGDLFSYIQYKGGKLGDIEAAVIVRQVLMALEYLHDRDVVHRDLKPDNILMTSLADGCRVVLTDFGCARMVQPSTGRMSTVIGTFDYSAPEVLKSSKQGYTKAVDLWSLGCVTAVLLTGEIPFKDAFATSPIDISRTQGIDQLEANLKWNNAGKRAADFVRRLLVFDETERMNVKQALHHSWFSNSAHRNEFEALYKRSIGNWKPRVRKETLIVNIRDLITASKERENSKSHSSGLLGVNGISIRDGNRPIYEPTALSTAPSSGGHIYRGSTVLSVTLSDPELPPHYRIEGQESSLGHCWRNIDSQSQLGSDAASPMSMEEPGMHAADLDESSQISDDNWLEEKVQESIFEHKDTIKGKYLANQGIHITLNPRPEDWTPNPLAMAHDIRESQVNTSSWDGEEVYEEINNIVTGKRQHVVYGTNIYQDLYSSMVEVER
ncbi:FHA domain-containing serine/threonine-protein kinase [Aspergillus tanneri]|uniref:Uncharacterized protein n=1 Tax=Aspergillus tanneri TaxID=1220188 RepID=A0A5M9M8B4_9EURO|nr:uncharacterized protein ATNIH1004_010775 [Aspergillus tanneri]KAA8641836.1 hypothetical protein ATNIH1004_010775 [Aspergillus tanneri]